jgi:hypothetical protein
MLRQQVGGLLLKLGGALGGLKKILAPLVPGVGAAQDTWSKSLVFSAIEDQSPGADRSVPLSHARDHDATGCDQDRLWTLPCGLRPWTA